MKIIATDIYKKFRQEWVFKSLNYTFESGNSYAIVGQNGAGKSTLLKTLAQYSLPNKGKVEFEGITENIKFPMDITCIKLQLIPSDMTKFHNDFLGLETIVYNTFKSNNKPFQDDLKKGDVYLKTYFKKDDFYTIPLLCLDIIFFRKLNSKTIDNLWKVLKSEIVLFTGDVGNIEQKVFYSKSSILLLLILF